MLQELTVCLSVHLCCRGTARSEAVRLFHVYGCKHLFFFLPAYFIQKRSYSALQLSSLQIKYKTCFVSLFFSWEELFLKAVCTLELSYKWQNLMLIVIT